MSELANLIADLALPASPAKLGHNLKIATMSAVKAELGSKAGIVSLPAVASTQTLTSADMGKVFVYGGSVASVINLPNASTIPDGTSVTLVNSNLVTAATYTLTANGAQTITAINAPATTLPLQPGDIVELTVVSGNWVMSSGCSVYQMARSAGFSSLQATTGYQKLPNGVTLQWGQTGAIASGGSAAVVLPYAFVTLTYAGVASVIGGSAGSTPFSGGINAISATGFTMLNLSSASASFFWFVIGK